MKNNIKKYKEIDLFTITPLASIAYGNFHSRLVFRVLEFGLMDKIDEVVARKVREVLFFSNQKRVNSKAYDEK